MRFGFYSGETDKTIYVRLRDSTTGLAKTGLAFNSAGAVCSYVLPLAARAAITLATQTVTGAHTDGGFVEVDATNCKGLYRLDLPDAAIASGSFSVVSIEFDGTIEESILLEIDTQKVNATQFAGQTITAAAGVTLPSSVASPTNITAGTITTVTNLTNLPTIPNNWLTAAGIADDAITAAKIANGAIDAATFAADVDAEIRSYVGLASANLDTQLADIPTVAEFEARTLVAASYFDPATDGVTLADGVTHGGTTASLRLGSSSGPGLHVTSSATSSAAVYIENLANLSNGLFIQSGSGDAVNINSSNAHGIEIMGLSGVFEAGLAAAIQAEATDALNAYDPPTNAEMVARTLAAASYFDPAADTVAHVTLVDTTTTNTDMRGTDNAATAAALATAQTAIDAIPTNAELATALDPLPTAAENAAAILAAGDVDGYSLEEAIKLCLAALVGKLSGAATATIVIRAADDSKARITATVDVDGNRSAVTLDETG